MRTRIGSIDAQSRSPSSRVTAAGTGAVNFPLSFSGGTQSGPVTLTETKSYDTRFGIASIETNPNGAYATRLLDGFGRVYGERAFNAGGVKIASEQHEEATTPEEAGREVAPEISVAVPAEFGGLQRLRHRIFRLSRPPL